ncbi:MAG TPA: ARMT1-like domain-containing protein [Dictyoglomaceae bacterium]|nr:ARMT1-like domain-containing protein [Dictyoglomaceae bacterium]HPP16297.1 ARMT1-like domain-containing protein [Dictyoglomaceae bacterium]
MNTKLECFPCFLKQAISALKRINLPEERKMDIMKDISQYISTFNTEESPAYNTYLTFKKIYELANVEDPYYEEKKSYNTIALSFYKVLKNIVESSNNPLYTAIKVAIAGNIIDLGILDISKLDLRDYISKIIEMPLKIDHYYYFKNELQKTDNILYLLDNAGEIVFDKILIEELSKEKEVTAVVNEYPIINDALMEDAIEVGLNKSCKLISSGSGTVGKIPEFGSKEFQELFYNSKLIISKGQANYENLEGRGYNIFFLLKAKCELVAQNLEVNFGDLVFLYEKVISKKD